MITEEQLGKYRVEQNPRDKQWYILGLIRGRTKNYWVVVSDSYPSKEKAFKYMQTLPTIERAQYQELLEEEPVKGEQAGMLGVPGKYVEQRRPWTPGQMEFESYSKYEEAMKQAEKPSKNLYWYSIADLKKMCLNKGLNTEGSKEDLIRRLKHE